MDKIFYLLLSGALLLSNLAIGNTYSIDTEYSPNNKLKIVRSCYEKNEWETVCSFSFATADKPLTLLMDDRNKNDEYLTWLDNIAYLYLGSCGSPCSINAFVNEKGQVDLFVNLIAVDPENQCVAYPDENGIIFRNLFSKKIRNIVKYKDHSSLKRPAQLAMVKGIFNKSGDIALSYFSTDLSNSENADDGEGQLIQMQVSNPCKKAN